MALYQFSILSMCSRTLHLELSKLFHSVLMQQFHLFTHSTNFYGRPTMLRHSSGSRDGMNEIHKALALTEPTTISIKFHQFCFVCDLRISICILMVTPNKFTLSLRFHVSAIALPVEQAQLLLWKRQEGDRLTVIQASWLIWRHIYL